MKSCRLKSVALTWLHGGHQSAPQYRKTGFDCARASPNAASTSASVDALRQAMPAASATACGAAARFAAGVAAAVDAAAEGSGAFEQAPSSNASAAAHVHLPT